MYFLVIRCKLTKELVPLRRLCSVIYLLHEGSPRTGDSLKKEMAN